jgi:hypothetical protein
VATETLMVASTLDLTSTGQEFRKLPAHMTYISWFKLPGEFREAFASRMEEVTTEHRAPRPMVGETERFGNEELGYASVHRLDSLTAGFNPIQDFYPQAILSSFASSVDADFNTQFFGVDWHPHMEYPNLNKGNELIFNNLTVFKKDELLGKKVVQAVYPWERP